MKTSKTSRKIFKSRTLIILPHFPLENPNLEKKHLTPTILFLSSEWLILLILLQYDLSLTWIVQSYFRKKLFELFPRSHLMLTLMLYSKVCKYWNSSSSWKVIGGGVGEQGGRIPPNKNLEGAEPSRPPHTHTHRRVLLPKNTLTYVFDNTCDISTYFSALRQLKNYLRSTMKQDCLNNCQLMYCHKSITDTLDTVKVVCANEQRKGYFEKIWLKECVWLSGRWAPPPPPLFQNAPPPLKVYVFLIKKGLLPNVFKDMFFMTNQVHSYNTRNSNTFYLFPAQTNIRLFGIT